jgi:hypothetical protein
VAGSRLPIDFAARLAIWRRLGWVELSAAEENCAWHRFEATFGHFGTGIPRRPLPGTSAVCTMGARNCSVGWRRT